MFGSMVVLYATGFLGFRELFSFSTLNTRMVIVIVLCVVLVHLIYLSMENLITYIERKVGKS